MPDTTWLLIVVGAATVVWVGAIGVGVRALLRYENTPGQTQMAIREWPAETSLKRPADRYTLVVFAHPDCPCTRATLTELDELTTRLRSRLAIFVRFRKPGATLAEVRASELWRTAASMREVSPGLDPDRREARMFGARTSGQALLFDPKGRLVFSGGVTDARGHVGDNPGLEAVTSLVFGRMAQAHTPVFGCSLIDPEKQDLNSGVAWRKN